MEKNPMTDIRVFGFPASSFVHIVRLVLTHKEAPYMFHDLEPVCLPIMPSERSADVDRRAK